MDAYNLSKENPLGNFQIFSLIPANTSQPTNFIGNFTNLLNFSYKIYYYLWWVSAEDERTAYPSLLFLFVGQRLFVFFLKFVV